MLLGFLRFVAYTLVFIFIYRVIVGALRYLAGDSGKRQASRPDIPHEPKKTTAPEYHDVKDAQFKDVPPNNGSTPS